ncbi:glucokinase [Marinomonas agarivorans]|nr:glucokinase [Marinomonas agarivorans]
MPYALIADLGGTNARFALSPIGQCKIQHVQVLPCADYDNLFAALDEYMLRLELTMQDIAVAVLAIAGPVNQPIIRFSNNPWQFSSEQVKDYFGPDKQVALLNDFDANGHSLEVLDSNKLIEVGNHKNTLLDKSAPAWVIGPGTGLGVACVVPQNSGPSLLLPGEGGHVDLPSATEQEDYILTYLRERHHRVSAERVLSGMGLENIYAALTHQQGQEARLSAVEIGAAFQAGDELAKAAMAQFFIYLGRVIGNLILNVESRGGVYIVGGIIPRYWQQFINSDFRSALEDKGRMSSLVSAIPIYIVTEEYPGLLGCANYASYLAKNAGIQGEISDRTTGVEA